MNNADMNRQRKQDRKTKAIEQRPKVKKETLVKETITKEEAKKSWEERSIYDAYNMLFEMRRGTGITQIPMDDPETLLKQAETRIKETWVKACQDDIKAICDQGNLTHAEKMAEIDRRMFGWNSNAKRTYLYKYVDGEAHVIEGADGILAAAYEFEQLFNK